MKSRETKQNDLTALTESLQNSKSAMVVSFTKLTVTKDQEFRSSLREVGANYQVVKNTLARIAVKGTQFEDATEHFKGVTAIAWTDNDPVVLSKAISKFMKANADIYTFKAGVVDGKLVDFAQLNTIANLPSKEELISKLLWVINSSAQGIVTIINAVPRDLAVVIKQIGESQPPIVAAPAAEVKAETPVPAPALEEEVPVEAEVSAEDTPAAAEPAPASEPSAEEGAIEAGPAEEAPAAQAETTPSDETVEMVTESAEEALAADPEDAAKEGLEAGAQSDVDEFAVQTEAESEAAVAAPDDKAEDLLGTVSEAEAEQRS